MSENQQRTTPLRKIELGVLVTVALAVIGFAFWLGKLQAQVDRVDADRLMKAFDSKVSEAISKSVVPRGTIIAWIVCDGAPASGTPDLRSRFLRGTTDYAQVGKVGGRESHHHDDVRKNGKGDGEGWQKEHDNILGKTDEQNHLPPYCDVIYIMKRAA
jgi:hypothetical protein